MEMRTVEQYSHVAHVLSNQKLHTVCQSAKCPNRHGCWSAGTATFMIMGDTCTRNCAFCGIANGKPQPLEKDEGARIAEAVSSMKLDYVVITSVTRDDLPNGGADHFAGVIQHVKALKHKPAVEVLIPDFYGDPAALDLIIDAAPDVFNHNIETVERLQSMIRPQASYRCSMRVLSYLAKNESHLVKSGIMVGLGETDEEVLQTITDLANAGCRVLTIGQYLSPGKTSLPVQRYVSPDVFDFYGVEALKRGFKAVASAPMVRSSYQAVQLVQQAKK